MTIPDAFAFPQASQVTIKRIERNKRKFVTAVHGLEAFGTCTIP